MDSLRETAACTPSPLRRHGFNTDAALPFGCTTEHIQLAMQEFIDFLAFINGALNSRRLSRLETMLMSANFSSLVSEFMSAAIPKYCGNLVRNRYHNGHPDLIPAGRFPNDAVQYAHEGIELKASRYLSGWQGHNPEAIWLLVICFAANTPADITRGIEPIPFRFQLVAGAQLEASDWAFSGRSTTSRRTITASVTKSGYDKMMANWIYKA